jgi:hypothetical protein
VDHCQCCSFAQQSPPYDQDGICPKCKTEGEIKFNGGDLLCLACGSYIDGPDKSVADLYAQIAREGRERQAWIGFAQDVIDDLARRQGDLLQFVYEDRYRAILRGDYGEED